MRTFSSAIEQGMCQDFTAHFGVIGERRRAFNSGKTFRATRGESAATSDSKAPRTPTDSTPTMSAFLQHVPIRRREEL